MAILAGISYVAFGDGFTNKAKKASDENTVGVLNRITQAYRVEYPPQSKDVFEKFTTNQARQQALINAGMWDEIVYPTYKENGDEFLWDVASQKWMIKDSSSGSGSCTSCDGTIADEMYTTNINGKYESGKKYQYNDRVEYNGKWYKYISASGAIQSLPPGSFGNQHWKEIKLEYDNRNYYENGDVVLYNGEYYKYIGNDFNWQDINEKTHFIVVVKDSNTGEWVAK